jgi:hypothetical protein
MSQPMAALSTHLAALVHGRQGWFLRENIAEM